jgi:putative transposase
MTFSRRHLPHWSPDGHDLFITWRLHDSLPADFRPSRDVNSSGKAFVTVDRVLDHAQTGPLWLKDSRVTNAVFTALTDGQRQKLFELREYVLMANHVHVLLTPRAQIAQITHQIKGASVREANLILGRTGSKF